MNRVAWIAAVTVLLDQATKIAIEQLIGHGSHTVYQVVPGFFNILYVDNTGAAWGIMRGQNGVLAVISALTIVALIWFRRHFPVHRPWPGCAMGLILGGIAGNLIDRLRVGHVIDFLDFYFRGWHWPAFNVADSAICVGVVLYIATTWRDAHSVSAPVSTG